MVIENTSIDWANRIRLGPRHSRRGGIYIQLNKLDAAPPLGRDDHSVGASSFFRVNISLVLMHIRAYLSMFI